jgi:spermidine/putrescine transport system permease protein
MAFGAFAGGTAPATAERPGPTRKSPVALFLLLPGLAYLALFFLVPLISLIITSLKVPDYNADFGQYTYGLNFQIYFDVIWQYRWIILRSFGYALAATVFALAIGYPLAYFIGVKLRKFPLVQALALTLVIAPFFISFLLRTLAWKQIMSDEGPVLSFLNALSILPPDTHFTGTPGAVIFGLTYNFIPFMTLPIYASLSALDLRYLEAGSDLYASPATTFARVTVPLSLPGVVSGTLLTFIPAAGDYVNASRDFLGSTETAMIGNVVEAQFLQAGNYPVAATLSIVLMAAILLIVGVYIAIVGTKDLV